MSTLQRVEEVFHAALDQEPDRISEFLDQRCDGDEPLRREVEALLASHYQAASFIEAPLINLDTTIFEDGQSDRLIGQSLGPYRILKTMGIGGMGVVYLARRDDEQYQKLVAIKLIKRGMDTDSVLRHFHNERQILASFEHPNIARLLDGGTTDSGLPYFVMEHVEGLPVDEYCNAHALLITERLKLFRHVCDAVTYAHRHAVIHRDIKPSNILVSADGVPKLLDFGIAKILQPGDGGESLATMVGQRLMTPDYASPEQVRGEPLTTATDVYSLGVVLYRLLTGCPPYRFASRSAHDIERVIGEWEPQKPSTIARTDIDVRVAVEGGPDRLRRRLRGDLDNIVLMALRKEPKRRYQSVEQFSEDIRRHLEMLPVLARKDTFAYRSLKFVRRNMVSTAAAALVFLTLLGGIMATAWQARRARAQEAVAKAEKARAERRFNDVRQLARSVLFDYHDAIKNLSGATPVRQRLVKDALVYLDSLAREGGDAALQRELAAAYERVGDVRGQAFSASLGDTAGAMDSYLKALRIREALAAANPQDVESRRDLARSYTRIGTRLLETSETAEGLEYLRKGFTVYRELAAQQPTSTEIRYDLAATYNDLGLALEEWGDASGALENHRNALALRQEFVAADSDNQEHRRNLSVTYVNLGRALVLGGDIKGGLDSNQKGLVIRAALFADNPSNADYRRLLAISYQNDGDYRIFLDDFTGALQSFRKKLALDKKSLAEDPLNALSREDFGYSCQRLGYLMARSGNYGQALSYYRDALEMDQKLLADSPQSIRIRHHAVLLRAYIGEMQAKLGNREAALAECSTAIDLLRNIPIDPMSSWQGSVRGQVYMHLAEAYSALATSADGIEQRENWRSARKMYARSLTTWQEMKRRGILTGEDASKPEEIARQIVRCDHLLRR